jgi:hypothetical protein
VNHNRAALWPESLLKIGPGLGSETARGWPSPVLFLFRGNLYVYWAGLAEERISHMSESTTALFDEAVLGDDLPDEVLEVAGSKCSEGPASSFTVSFCSGVDTCPSIPQ